MEFIVDAMFGRLARWLRISGYDTIYDTELKDGRMVMLAKKQGRVLITRDRDVYSRALKEGVIATFVSSLDFLEQLYQLESEYGLEFKSQPESARCPACNSELKVVNKKDIKTKLPENVENSYEDFWMCSVCGRVYWHGGHWQNISETIKKLRVKAR